MIKENGQKFIDLFAGAGGLSEGFLKAGYQSIAHVEMDTAACNTLRTRTAYHFLKNTGQINFYNSYLKGEITRADLYALVPAELLRSVINLPIGSKTNGDIYKSIDQQLNQVEVDLIIGGPPCQAYSLVGRARSEDGMKRDPRNFLYVQYAEYLQKYQPKMFVFENVLGLKSAGNGIYLQNMEKLFLKKGYKIHVFSVKAEKYGVLQKRRRLLIIGWKQDFIPNLPDFDNYLSQISGTVGDVLQDLPTINAGGGVDKYANYTVQTNNYLKNSYLRNNFNILTQHIARPQTEQDKKIYQIAVMKWNENQERLNYNDLSNDLKTHKNRNSFTDRFKVVANNLSASHTVVAHIAKDGHYYIHPDITQNRSISVREAARLQSFPDDFYFEGVKENANRTAAYKQIGNAVPPLMSYEIATMLDNVLCPKK